MTDRQLIVSGPSDDPRVAAQVRALRSDADGVAERELAITEREADAFSVELLAKDGGLTARWEDLVGREELWARIDAMPMRRKELRRRERED
jgi:hypothetical protein